MDAESYREWLPAPDLRPDIMCTWSHTTSDQPGQDHVVLPDACVDIVCIGDGPPIVAGPATVPIRPNFPAGTLIVGARFRPGAAPSWLGIGAYEILNRDVVLADLMGRPARELGQRIGETSSAWARRQAIEIFLRRRRGSARSPDRLVDDAISRLARSRTADIGALTGFLGLSGRQLLRRFRERLGYGPKTFHRILRLQRLLLVAGPGRNGNLADLAQEAGFSDQAHMAREVASLAGSTTASLLRQQAGTLGMSDLFKRPLVDRG